MKKTAFLLVVLCFFPFGCRDNIDRAYLENLVSMSEPKYDDAPVSAETISEIKAILSQYQEKVQKKVAAVEEVGKLYEKIAQKYLEIETLRQTIDIQPDEDTAADELNSASQKEEGVYYNAVGLSLIDRGIYKKAYDYLLKALDIFPASGSLFYQMAVCTAYIGKSYIKTDKNDKQGDRWIGMAENYYKKAIQLNPSHLDAQYGLGILYMFELNRPEEAIKYFLPIRESQSQNTDVRFALGQAYYMLGQYDNAIQMYDEILAVTRIRERIKRAEENKKQVENAKIGY
ncbi:MAG: tetratricopeptide repeat protein [Spirochaetales bacterium]|nr:tetratricopeptide repeat protein [Spirochaetales bacterium]